jgi:hypothetical protein
MADRRALIEGLDTIDETERERAEEFVYSKKPRAAAKAVVSAPPAPPEVATQPSPSPMPALPAVITAAAAIVSSPLTGVGRVLVGARVRTELAAALKRASLERQLHGIQPNSIQDILEESLELWLHKHGLLR